MQKKKGDGWPFFIERFEQAVKNLPRAVFAGDHLS